MISLAPNCARKAPGINPHRPPPIVAATIMAGTITLLYDHSTRGLQKQLADLQHSYIDEVISSLHVHLMHNQTMEVILVQGPASTLQRVADEMITLRGVITGKMQLMAAVIPQLHPLPKGR